jgi:hypothetical protein
MKRRNNEKTEESKCGPALQGKAACRTQANCLNFFIHKMFDLEEMDYNAFLDFKY